MQITVYTPTGQKSGTVTLPKEIFSARENKLLMAQATRTFLSNQRQGTKKAKSRGEIKGSTRKIYRQKGTGRARHGDRYAPIFVGGGVAHGPTGKENYKLKLTKAMKKQALFSALTTKAKAKEILVVDKLETLKPKTKLMSKVINTLLNKNKLSPKSKISLVLPQPVKSITRSSRNLSSITTLQARQLNTYKVLNGGTLIFMKPSIKVLKETFLKSAKQNHKD